MPLSTRRYTELRLAISTCVQSRDWKRLFEVCGTNDDETAKAIAGIFTLHDFGNVWKFLDYVLKLPPEERRQKRDSVATCCYIVGKMGQSNTKKALATLRTFLSEDHMLRMPALSALSNLWVLDYRTTATLILQNWILRNEDNDDLEEIGVKSIEYLASQDPKIAGLFLLKVAKLSNEHKIASRTAWELAEKHLPRSFLPKEKKNPPAALRIHKKR